ncbi:dsDNA nuclease domain-containing protein [Kitasatospora purpeofusca]|uniref:dsDNA nuclease domain-containing protein n=1 Tax=Kitasatospora purpeofusca TaxID=67352 RepID=UPI002A5B0CF9|nr:dsDNA nuclease domain-containing protein [Kitasatospora purpeofusca]MDY0814039.1 dsDNA nuclease domain-containing protein [Kitasatospora purpeofusca]
MNSPQISAVDAFLNSPPPEDSGTETASRYYFQYQCAARHCLAMILGGSLKSVICEWHTDYSLEYDNGTLHLVSVKHRELSAGPWPLADLWGKGGLKKLFGRWRESPDGSRCRLVTNGVMKGGKDRAVELETACKNRDQSTLEGFADDAMRRLSCSKVEAIEFLTSLDLEVGVPDRTTMRADSIVNLATKIIPDFKDRGIDLSRAWDSVVNLVASASRDFDSRDYADQLSLSSIDGLHAPRLVSAKIHRRTITKEDVLKAISESPASPAIQRVSNIKTRRPRGRFFGRQDSLASIRDSLSSFGSDPAVVAVVGMSGVGKTELLRQFISAAGDEADFVWWIVGESWTSIASDLLELGSELGITSDSPQRSLDAVIELVARNHGLIVIDGAMAAPEIIEFVARVGKSQVLVSSTDQTWSNYAAVINLRPLPIDDSIQLLKSSLPIAEEADLEALSVALGGHPLALLQAAGYISVTGLSVDSYTSILRGRTRELMARALPVEHIGVAAAWDVTVGRLKEDHPNALTLLQVFSFFADQVFPKELFGWTVPSVRSEEEIKAGAPAVYRQGLSYAAECEYDLPNLKALRTLLADPIHLHDAIFALRKFSLLEVEGTGLRCHSLLQALARQSCSQEESEGALLTAAYLLYKVTYLAPNHSDHWPHYAHILPHFESVIDSLAGIEQARFCRVLFCTSISEYLGAVGLRASSLGYSQEAFREFDSIGSSDMESDFYVRGVLMEALAGADMLDEALDLGNHTLNRPEVGQVDGFSVAIIKSRMASLYHLKGDLKGALAALESCEASFSASSVSSDSHSVLAIRSSRASLARELGDAKLAISEFLRCIDEVGDNASGSMLSTLHCNLSLSYLENGDFRAALDSSLVALDYDQKISHGDHASTARDWNNAGLALFELGLIEKATEAFSRSAEIYEGLEGSHTTRSLTAQLNLARAHDAAGSHVEARKIMENVLARQEELLGPAHREVAVTLVNLATVYTSLGLNANAVKVCKRAIDIDKAVYGERHPELIADLNNFANSLMRLGQSAAAIKWLRLALDISLESFGIDNVRTAKCLEGLANVEALCGQIPAAVMNLGKAIAIYCGSVGPEHPDALRAEKTLRLLTHK